MEQLFNETGRLIRDQTEINGVITIDFKELTWRSTSLFCSRAYQITNAKTLFFSDSVLCVGKMGDDPSAAWKKKINWYSEKNHFKELNRIDGMETEFEWKIFPRLTTLGLFEKIQNLTKDLQCESEQVNDRIIFMSMYNDIVWREEGNTEKCVTNSVTLAKYARRFPRGRWSFLGPGSEKKWYGTHYFDKPDGNCSRTAEMMMLQLHTESCHQIFVASSRFERGELRSKSTW